MHACRTTPARSFRGLAWLRDDPVTAAVLASGARGVRWKCLWQEVQSLVRSGKPCIKGTRVTAYDVLEYLAGGMTEDEILSDFPDLARDDIRAALALAATRERRLANSVA
jgi:uncharacterized protein (DUF433 family)